MSAPESDVHPRALFFIMLAICAVEVAIVWKWLS